MKIKNTPRPTWVLGVEYVADANTNTRLALAYRRRGVSTQGTDRQMDGVPFVVRTSMGYTVCPVASHTMSASAVCSFNISLLSSGE